MLPHPLTNFEIQKYYHQNEARFNGACSRNNLPNKIKNGVCVINLDQYADVSAHWIALLCRSEIVYFDNFGVEHVPEEVKEFIRNKNIIPNIFWVQANNSIICGYFCMAFTGVMFAGKKLTASTSLFSPYNLKKMTV